MHKSFLTVALSLAFTTPTFAGTTDWVVFDVDHHLGGQGIKSTFITAFEKADYSKKSFNKPFWVKSRFTHLSGYPNKKYDTYITTDTIVDCKNLRYAEAKKHYLDYVPDLELSTNEKTVIKTERSTDVYFDSTKPVPEKAWKRFDSASTMNTLMCAHTQGYVSNKSLENKFQPDWQLVKLTKGPTVYLNKSDLKQSNSDQPFILRTKLFGLKGDRTLNNKPYTSYITHGTIDCKKMKSVVLKNVYYSNDYEYVVNKAPSIVYTQSFFKNISSVPEKSWNEINKEFITDIGICATKTNKASNS